MEARRVGGQRELDERRAPSGQDTEQASWEREHDRQSCSLQ